MWSNLFEESNKNDKMNLFIKQSRHTPDDQTYGYQSWNMGWSNK